jgi:hypothetical protein
VRVTILARAHALACHQDQREPLSLETLALILDVHVRTLRTAARDGRLKATYNTFVAFGKPVPRASLDAGDRFMRTCWRRRLAMNGYCLGRPRALCEIRQANVICLQVRAAAVRRRGGSRGA